MRRVSIFGSTGSIGRNTVDLIRRNAEAYTVVALTGGRNVDLLAQQAKMLNAEIAVTAHEECLPELKAALAESGVDVAAGRTALLEAAEREADWIISAIVGAAGLPPGLKALEQGTTVALANKESLVTAGPLVMATARKHGATLLPVDSEHSGIFQALIGEELEAVERVVITASGGAFRNLPIDELKDVTVEQASSHPNWDMGQRITIDSASMFNKALEIIETKEFFGISSDKIEAIIHPESFVHAMVGFRDGALMAHVGPHDMRHAIGFALNWPKREELPVERLNLADVGSLTFREPDPARYPALALSRDVIRAGGLTGAAFNAAKEAALDAFISGRIGFLDMASAVADVIEKMSGDGLGNAAITLDSVQNTDQMARIRAEEFIEKRQR